MINEEISSLFVSQKKLPPSLDQEGVIYLLFTNVYMPGFVQGFQIAELSLSHVFAASWWVIFF